MHMCGAVYGPLKRLLRYLMSSVVRPASCGLGSRAVPRVGTPPRSFIYEGRYHPHVEPMINAVLTKVFGTHTDRELKRISEAYLGPINALEPAMEKLSDADLRHQTEEFKNRIANGETLDDILVGAFAAALQLFLRVLPKSLADDAEEVEHGLANDSMPLGFEALLYVNEVGVPHGDGELLFERLRYFELLALRETNR